MNNYKKGEDINVIISTKSHIVGVSSSILDGQKELKSVGCNLHGRKSDHQLDATSNE